MEHMHHPAMGHAGHDHHDMMIADFRKRFYITLVCTIPVMILSTMIQHWLGVEITFPGSTYLLLGLSTFIFFYGGWPFLKGWYDEMKPWNPGMMTLIGFAITVAYVYSVGTVLGLKGMDFFWELATLILIMLLGHWIEMRSVAGASRELELLVQLMPDDAHLIKGEQVTDVKTETLKENDLILVKPGEKIAADGVIVEGESYINESLLTGESSPVEKKKNDKVIAGSINGNGAIKITVTHGAKDSYLSQVVKLVKDAQNAKSKTQLLVDNAARWLTLIAIVSGIVTFIVWYLSGRGLAFAIERMVTVIVICCPHALGLAVPLVVTRSTALSAKNGPQARFPSPVRSDMCCRSRHVCALPKFKSFVANNRCPWDPTYPTESTRSLPISRWIPRLYCDVYWARRWGSSSPNNRMGRNEDQSIAWPAGGLTSSTMSKG